QAEDGIRDFHVTGVQTCALPIFRRGERIYLYDGKVRMIVTSVTDGVVHARADNDGILIERKGINLPDTDFAGDIITDKDKKDIRSEERRVGKEGRGRWTAHRHDK